MHMVSWKRSKDEFPPINKKIIVCNPENGKLSICTVGYIFSQEENSGWPTALSAETIRKDNFYYMEIPEVPNG